MDGVIGGRAATVLASAATVVAGMVAASGPAGPSTTAFLLVAPALPAVVAWRSLGPWVRWPLAGAVALVVDAVVAEVMLGTGHWEPSAGVRAVALVSAALWIGDALAWNALAGARRERRT